MEILEFGDTNKRKIIEHLPPELMIKELDKVLK